MTYGDAGT